MDAFFGENGGELKGERFTLQIQSQKEWGKNRHHVRVREQDPKQYLKLFNNVDITPLHESMLIPIYDVEIKARNPDTVVGGMNLLVPVEANKELGTDFIVLEQDKTSSSWNDITEKCKMDKCLFTESTVISIPVEKSSKVWVVRVKKSLHSLLHVLLVLLLGNVHFRILGFFRVRNKDICLRIIGITENLYQNPKRLRTEVEIAEEGGFQKVEESDAKLLLRRGKLLVSFYLAGNCQNSTHFDLGGTSTSKVAQRHDFKFSVGDLKRIPKVEIRTANDAEEVLWSIDLRNLIKVRTAFLVPYNLSLFLFLKFTSVFCFFVLKIQECAELSANITRPGEKK